MKQIQYLVAAALLLAGFGFSQVALAQTRIAVVNPMRLIREAPQAEKARNSLKAEFSSRRSALAALQKKLQGEQQAYNKNQSIMSASERKNKQGEIERDAQTFRSKQDSYNRDVQAAEQKAFGRLREKIFNVISSVAKRRHYDVVLGDGVVYAAKSVDITDEVLRQLKRDDRAGR